MDTQVDNQKPLVTDKTMECDDYDLKEMNCQILSEQMTSVVSTLEEQDTASVSDTNFNKNLATGEHVVHINSEHEVLMDNAGNKTEELDTEDLHEADNQQFNDVQIKVINVPDDDDLFDFFNKDKSKNNGEELCDAVSDEENQTDIHKGELYRYLTTDDLHYTPTQSNEVTPYHSGEESDTSVQSDSVVYLSSDVESDRDESLAPDHSSSRCETPVLEEELKELRQKPRRKQKLSKTSSNKQSASSGQLSEKTLEKLERCKVATNKWLKDLELPKSLSLDKPLKFQISDLNQYLTCGLCKGYLYEASTITECMHTFCKNCIVRHCMEVSLHCPVCNILIHPTDPFVHIRLDRMIQDIVYKMLPKVAETEFQNMKDFYAAHPEAEPQEIPEPPVECEDSPPKPDLSLPQTQLVSILLQSDSKSDEGPDLELEKKFVRVVSRATIQNVCNFLKNKLSLQDDKQVSIFCCGSEVEDMSCTLENIQNKYFVEEDPLVLLQYRISDDAVS